MAPQGDRRFMMLAPSAAGDLGGVNDRIGGWIEGVDIGNRARQIGGALFGVGYGRRDVAIGYPRFPRTRAGNRDEVPRFVRTGL